MTGYETVLASILGRLTAAPKTWADDIRRAHLTAPPKSAGRVVHLIDGEDAPDKGARRDCTQRDGAFSLALFVRSDLGVSAADPMKIEVMRRLAPDSAPYPDGVAVKPGRVVPSANLADNDAIRIDMDFTFCYPATDWTL